MQKTILVATIMIVVLIAGIISQVEAKPNPNSNPNGKVRAIQNGISIDTNNPGILNVDIDCVGGINYANANDFHCFLVPDGIGIGNIDWPNLINGSNLPNGVILLSTTQSIPCPDNAGFQNDDTCFSVTFGGGNFTNPAHWHFIGVFTENGNVIDIVGQDYRVHSFNVLPEAVIGAIALIGSILGITAYRYRRMI